VLELARLQFVFGHIVGRVTDVPPERRPNQAELVSSVFDRAERNQEDNQQGREVNESFYRVKAEARKRVRVDALVMHLVDVAIPNGVMEGPVNGVKV